MCNPTLLVYSRNCTTLPPSISEHFHYLKKQPHFSWPSSPNCPHSQNPRQPLIYLCLQRWPIPDIHIHGITQYVVFCDCLLLLRMVSRLIYVVAWINTSFLLSYNLPLNGYTNFCLFIFQLKDICVVSTFSLLQIMTLWTFMYKFSVNLHFLFLRLYT